jgi:Ca-activated chloride channel family protein
MFRFATPYFFLLLAVLPAAFFYSRRKRLHPVMRISGVASVKDIPGSLVLKAGWILPFMKYLALILLIIALARPQWGTRHVNILTEGINIILAVDISESMAALDFKSKGKMVNRLEAVKVVINDFISKRNGDRIGMVVFGTHAYTQVPLTRDYNTISSVLKRLKIGAAGKSTSIGDAIGISLKRLEDLKSLSNVIILLTDGRSNSGELSPETAVGIAVDRGVKIYSIGVGSRGKAPFLVNHPLLGQRYVYQRVDIDEDTLKNISEQTDGLYFRAEDSEKLKEIYDKINLLEKTEVKVKTYAEYREFYLYFLVAAFIIMSLRIVFSNTRFLRVP